MRNDYFFQLNVTPEQVAHAQKLVDFSMANHPVSNIWDGTSHQKRTVELRFTGSLGEVVFADAYGLPRPNRSFGAIDGQDWGLDFELVDEAGFTQRFDLKTMRRKHNSFYENYVLNIPAGQLDRPDSLTDCYFHVSIHENPAGQFVASFVGFVLKEAIKNGEIGRFFAAGAERKKADGDTFRFHADTWEIELKDFYSPPVTETLQNRPDFLKKHIKTASKTV